MSPSTDPAILTPPCGAGLAWSAAALQVRAKRAEFHRIIDQAVSAANLAGVSGSGDTDSATTGGLGRASATRKLGTRGSITTGRERAAQAAVVLESQPPVVFGNPFDAAAAAAAQRQQGVQASLCLADPQDN